jgi:hypothetical protein
METKTLGMGGIHLGIISMRQKWKQPKLPTGYWQSQP